MKKLLLLLAILSVAAVGCSKDDADKDNDNKTEQPDDNEGGNEDDIPENILFGLDKESVTFSPYGGSVDVIVYSNYKWEISGTSDWCTPSAKGGDANEDGLKVTFSADVAYDDRETTFWFRCADKQIKFVVSQKSNNAIIYYTSSNGKIVTPYDSSSFGATILSNTYKDGVGVIEFDVPITTIGDYAFYQCSSLTSLTIPDSVTTIGEAAFYECSSLTSVTIPDSVTSIGYYAFSDCYSLTSVTIPDSVTTIGEWAFAYCSSLTSVTIPDSVTTIGEWAFYYCISLTSVTIPDSVTVIEHSTFIFCYSLTSVDIPDSVTSIGNNAFQDCRSLTSVTIPDSVTEIGYFTFANCENLNTVYCKAINPPTTIVYNNGYWCAFDENASGRKIYVPMESVEAYKSADGWNEYKSYIVGYDF